MGSAPSHEIALCILNRDEGLKTLIKDQDFADKCRKYWSDAPEEVQAFIRGLVTGSRIWTSSTLSTATYKLHKEIESNLNSWEKDPKSFFHRGTLVGNISSLYRYIQSFDKARLLDIIRRRIALITVHKLKEALKQQNLPTRLASLVTGGTGPSEENCLRWAEWGASYERYLPTKGGDRDLFLEIQEQRQIKVVAERCQRAADQVLKYANDLMLAALHKHNYTKGRRQPVDYSVSNGQSNEQAHGTLLQSIATPYSSGMIPNTGTPITTGDGPERHDTSAALRETQNGNMGHGTGIEANMTSWPGTRPDVSQQNKTPRMAQDHTMAFGAINPPISNVGGVEMHATTEYNLPHPVFFVEGTVWSGDLAISPAIGPQLIVPIVVSDTAQSISFAMSGNIEGLQYLFGRQEATPRDISSARGFSLIRWALYGGLHHHETVKFLLHQGACIDDDKEEQDALQCITEWQDRNWLDEQKFPPIHQIILGLSPKLLVEELSDNPDAIHATDVKGRTALDWATARAQLEDVQTLIVYGSKLDSMDIMGRTTVLHAVDSHDPNVLGVLLQAGAHPDPHLPMGVFRSSPITSASFGGLPDMLRLLLRFGANINAKNPEGRTPLQPATFRQNVECAAILLEMGAKINDLSDNGLTPLLIAIMYNKHAMLRLFLSKHPDCLNYEQLRSTVTHLYSDTSSAPLSLQIFTTMSDQDASTPRVFIVRHGETEWAKIGRYTGISEVCLTSKGVAQVSSTATMLVGEGKLLDPSRLAHVFISPRKRARKTFELLFSAVEMQDVTETSDIAEWNYGDYEGLTTEEIINLRKERNLDSDRKWNIWSDGCESGESMQEVTERLDRIISEIRTMQTPHMAGETPGDVVLVAHGLILRCFVKRWLGYNVDSPFPMTLAPGAIAVLSYKNKNIEEPCLHIGLALPYQQEGGC
ncbi:hypothetical protein JX266_014076 [Neoarthrinium moseri]|nr:hypothetical protein JX266_014076 [Neoarthrinium moseri]